MCVGCRERTHRSVLLRVVVREIDGVASVFPDPARCLPGRGASVHRDPACVDVAERRRAFPRALRHGGGLDLTPLRAYLATGD